MSPADACNNTLTAQRCNIHSVKTKPACSFPLDFPSPLSCHNATPSSPLDSSSSSSPPSCCC